MKKIWLFSVLFSYFAVAEINARAVKNVSPIQDMEWTFETTQGFENIQNNLMSKEGGSTSQISQALQFTGILFHSYYRDQLLSKTQMNLGFDQNPPEFYWSEEPDFVHDADNILLEHLKCVQVDCQVFLPKVYFFNMKLSPFAGYSFINYSYTQTYNANYGDSFMYNCLLVGVDYSHRINAKFTHNYYFCYSPLMIVKAGEGAVRYINYGAELIANTSPIAFTLFISFRKAANKEYEFIFNNDELHFNTTEVGLSFHLSF